MGVALVGGTPSLCPRPPWERKVVSMSASDSPRSAEIYGVGYQESGFRV